MKIILAFLVVSFSIIGSTFPAFADPTCPAGQISKRACGACVGDAISSSDCKNPDAPCMVMQCVDHPRPTAGGGCSEDSLKTTDGTDLEGRLFDICSGEAFNSYPGGGSQAEIDGYVQQAIDRFHQASEEAKTYTPEIKIDEETMLDDGVINGNDYTIVNNPDSFTGIISVTPGTGTGVDIVLPPRIDPNNPCTVPGGHSAAAAAKAMDCSGIPNVVGPNGINEYEICMSMVDKAKTYDCSGYPTPAPLTCKEVQMYNVAYCKGDSCPPKGKMAMYVQADILGGPPVCGCDNPLTGPNDCPPPDLPFGCTKDGGVLVCSGKCYVAEFDPTPEPGSYYKGDPATCP